MYTIQAKTRTLDCTDKYYYTYCYVEQQDRAPDHHMSIRLLRVFSKEQGHFVVHQRYVGLTDGGFNETLQMVLSLTGEYTVL